MDWYYGCGNSDFLVPKDQEDLLEKHPSPDSWSEWGINAPEGFDSPHKCLFMDTSESEVEFNFFDESFNNEIEFDPCLYDKDNQFSSSSVNEGLPEQSSQQTALSDFLHAESSDKSFFYTENQFSNTTGGVQREIEALGFVPCNSDCKDCLDIQAHKVKLLDPFEQYSGNETMPDQLPLEELTLQGFKMLIAKFNEKTRICFRDALYGLARNTKQYFVEELDGVLNMHQEIPELVYNETMRSEDIEQMESETDSVNRAVAYLMFNMMEIN